MKEIGRTTNDDYIVEMTRDEYRALSRLAMAMEGKGLWDISATMPDRMMFHSDQHTVLNLLCEFTANRLMINELKDSVQSLDRLLSPEQGKEKSDER